MIIQLCVGARFDGANSVKERVYKRAFARKEMLVVFTLDILKPLGPAGQCPLKLIPPAGPFFSACCARVRTRASLFTFKIVTILGPAGQSLPDVVPIGGAFFLRLPHAVKNGSRTVVANAVIQAEHC